MRRCPHFSPSTLPMAPIFKFQRHIRKSGAYALGITRKELRFDADVIQQFQKHQPEDDHKVLACHFPIIIAGESIGWPVTVGGDGCIPHFHQRTAEFRDLITIY